MLLRSRAPKPVRVGGRSRPDALRRASLARSSLSYVNTLTTVGKSPTVMMSEETVDVSSLAVKGRMDAALVGVPNNLKSAAKFNALWKEGLYRVFDDVRYMLVFTDGSGGAPHGDVAAWAFVVLALDQSGTLWWVGGSSNGTERAVSTAWSDELTRAFVFSLWGKRHPLRRASRPPKRP